MSKFKIKKKEAVEIRELDYGEYFVSDQNAHMVGDPTSNDTVFVMRLVYCQELDQRFIMDVDRGTLSTIKGYNSAKGDESLVQRLTLATEPVVFNL